MLAHPGDHAAALGDQVRGLLGTRARVHRRRAEGACIAPPLLVRDDRGAAPDRRVYVAVVAAWCGRALAGAAGDWRVHVLLLLPIVAIMGAHMLAFGHSRYHLPLVPILILYAVALAADTAAALVAGCRPAARCGARRVRRTARLVVWIAPDSCSPMSSRIKAFFGHASCSRIRSDPARRDPRGAVRSRRHAVPSDAAAAADGDGAADAAALRDRHRTAKRLRALRAYRGAQEQLETVRLRSPRAARPGSPKRSRPAEAAPSPRPRRRWRPGIGLPEAEVAALVDEWMQRASAEVPQLVPDARARTRCWTALRDRGVRVGVLSDYPATAKLARAGPGRSLRVRAARRRIRRSDAFKPDPRGFLRACERWGLPPREVLMVGDRVDVDGAGAAAAGMPCVILGARPAAGAAVPRDCVFVASHGRAPPCP